MTPTPTASGLVYRRADFSSLTEALDFAATGATGINLYSLRGELAVVMPYSQLATEAKVLAARLLAAGFVAGDRIGLIAETNDEFVRTFFACQYAGLIPAPLPLPAPLGGRLAYVEQIGRMVRAADAAALFGPEALKEWISDAAQAGGVKRILDLADLPEADGRALPEIGPDDPCYLQFSSGSTRFPTGVLVSHRALIANARAVIVDGLKVQNTDRTCSWLPLYHDMGLVGFMLIPICSQMSQDLLPTGAFVRRPLLWLDLISRNGATLSYSPTFGYELCARRAEVSNPYVFDLSNWRVAGLGGDMVRAAPLMTFAERFASLGFRPESFVASYGMAEATLALTMAPLDGGLTVETLDIDKLEGGVAAGGGRADRQRAFVRCGPIFPDHELEIRDEHGTVLGDRQVGRAFVRGPSMMRGYFRNPEATNAALSPDGWLDTGDLGFLVGGEFTPTGRAKDLILLNGRNVWPQDLEWTAEQELDFLRSGDVAAFSITEDDDEKLVVLVQVRTSDVEARRKIADDVAALLRARHSVDPRVLPVGAHALPQTSSGKLSRSKARTLFLAGAFDTVAVS